ncbi:MAG: ThuA domain-containing protein [Rubripirellula sp.]|nr:ThuA domain-containing protein [Rubripirellula sp.]
MRRLFACTFTLLFLLCPALTVSAADPVKVLIMDGQNNHGDWPKTTAMMKKYLEETGRFQVDVVRTQYLWKGENRLKDYSLDDGGQYESLPQPKSDPDFKPDFTKYDVLINNFGWGAADLPDTTREGLEKFVSQGGGLVVVHAANNSWPKWDAYNKMIGLGGWGDRDEKSGPYVYINEEGEVIRDTSPGKGGGHGPQHNYQIVVRNSEHPITKGLPRVWMHTKDELYERLRGPADNMTILATAYADPKYKGTGRHEPMLMTIDFDRGRVFHTAMGHADYSMECVGFQTILERGTEWAATGQVTPQAVPKDFPTASESSAREF